MLFIALCTTMVPTQARRYESYSMRRDDGLTNIFYGALGVIGVVTGVYVLGSWLGWWNASNEQLIAQAERRIHAVNAHRKVITVLKQAMQQPVFDEMNESLLYEIALLRRHAHHGIDGYIHQIERVIANLRESRKLLNERRHELEHEADQPDIKRVCRRMSSLVNEIERCLADVKLAHDFLDQHRSYFQLFACEDRLLADYDRERILFAQYGYDQGALLYALRSHASSFGSCGAFTLISYVRKLCHDIALFEPLVARPAYNYAGRLGHARELLDQLYIIKQLLVSDPEYNRLLVQYEQAKRDEERLRLERQRTASQERKARAEQDKVWAEHRKARALEDQNRLRKKELDEQRRHNAVTEWQNG